MNKVIRDLFVLVVAGSLMGCSKIGIKQVSVRIDSEALEKHVEQLTSIKPPRNYSNLGSLNTAAEYIRNQFEIIGLTTEA